MRDKTFVDAEGTVHDLAKLVDQDVDVRLFLREALSVFGGYKGLATNLHGEFKAAPSGGNTRARILDGLVRIILRCTEPSDDMGGMGDDDLEAEIEALEDTDA